MLWRITRRRLGGSWRLLAVVLLVAVLAATTVASLGLLVVATEQAGLRSALNALPPAQSTVEVDLQSVTGSDANTTAVTRKAVEEVLGSITSVTSSTLAFTQPNETSVGRPVAADISYFGELADVRSHSTLVSGSWPTLASESPTVAIPVVIPAAGARAANLHIGDTVSVYLDFKGNSRIARIVGTYKATNPTGEYWGQDPLHGAGVDNSFPVFTGAADQTTTAFGPLLVAKGELDATAAPIDAMHLMFAPNFDRMTVDQLAPMINRLDTAQDELPTHMGYAAQQITFTSELEAPLTHIASNLIVTRSTVVIIILLLLVLAIAALAQTARLFSDAQAGERQLMLARGASRAQVFALSAIEAGIIAVLVALLSPVLARGAYQLLAMLPPMVKARMPGDSGLPPLAWELSLAVALVFFVVLVAPLLARHDTFVEAEQGKIRQRRGAGLLRSGLDLGLVVVAGVLYWQLLSYRTPVGGGASLSIDPVLAAAPVAVLLATALVSVRLIPVVARRADRFASRSRGSVFPLAAWEVGRRSRQATSAVLLLTLALAVGTFGQSFLATWKQSQVDQASVAVGPPVRIPAMQATAGTQATKLAGGAVGKPQPAIHRVGQIADVSGDSLTEDDVVLGLTPLARSLISSGRAGDLGGAEVAKLGASNFGTESAVVLPGDVRGLQATVRIGTPESALPGVAMNMAALVEDGNGLISTLQLGGVAVDGQPHIVRALLPVGARGVAPLRFVGFQAFATVSDRAAFGDGNRQTNVDILVGSLSVLHPGAGSGDLVDKRLRVDPTLPWSPESIGSEPAPSLGTIPTGWQFRLPATVPAQVDQDPAAWVLVGWTPIATVPAVITSGLAKSAGAHLRSDLDLSVSGADIRVEVVGIAKLVAGSSDFSLLTPNSASGDGTTALGAVAVDQATLERALIEGGQGGSMVDEWWVDVPSGHATAYLAKHASSTHGGVSRDALALQLQQDPLRIATQAALWLAIVAAALLAAIGFAVHTAASIRARRVEFAQLRAIGLSRSSLVGVVGAESVLLCAIGTVFGIAIGVLLGWLVGPLVAVSPDGSPSVPPVAVVIPAGAIALLVLEVVAVLAFVVIAVAATQRSISPAQILRGADE